MRIGVLSDTHSHTIRELPRGMVDELGAVDLLVHAGDYDSVSLLDELRALGKPFHGVYGNMDPPELRRLLPRKEVFEVQGFRVGVTHPAGGGPPFWIQRRVKKELREVDVIIYGHTHRTTNKSKGNVLYLNPGSATGKFPARCRAFAILKLDAKPAAAIRRF